MPFQAITPLKISWCRDDLHNPKVQAPEFSQKGFHPLTIHLKLHIAISLCPQLIFALALVHQCNARKTMLQLVNRTLYLLSTLKSHFPTYHISSSDRRPCCSRNCWRIYFD